MDEFLEQFLVESRELVEVATRELLALEQAPEEKDRLDGVFRTFHTLKGSAGIVDFSAMSRTMNIVEEALSAVRKGDASISPDFIGDCLKHDRPSCPVVRRDTSRGRFAELAGPSCRCDDRPLQAARTRAGAGRYRRRTALPIR